MTLFRTNPLFLRVLVAHFVLSPVLPYTTLAQVPPEHSRDSAMFHSRGPEHLMRGKNGHEMATEVGHWHHDGVTVGGGKVRIGSQWGEEMTVDIFMTDAGVMAEFNGHIQALTTFDESGNPMTLQVDVDGETELASAGVALSCGQLASCLAVDGDPINQGCSNNN